MSALKPLHNFSTHLSVDDGISDASDTHGPNPPAVQVVMTKDGSDDSRHKQ